VPVLGGFASRRPMCGADLARQPGVETALTQIVLSAVRVESGAFGSLQTDGGPEFGDRVVQVAAVVDIGGVGHQLG
jgi:hypothetical protein